MPIEVEYEALPGVANAEEALKPGAPLAREELDSNVCYTMSEERRQRRQSVCRSGSCFHHAHRQPAASRAGHGTARHRRQPRSVRQRPDRLALHPGAASRARRDRQHSGLSREQNSSDRAGRRRRLRQQRTGLPRRYRRLSISRSNCASRSNGSPRAAKISSRRSKAATRR